MELTKTIVEMVKKVSGSDEDIPEDLHETNLEDLPDHKIDSLAHMEMIMFLEDIHEIVIDDGLFDSLRTISDFERIIGRLKEEQN